MGVVDGGGWVFGWGVTEGVTEGSGVAEVGSAAGVTEVAAGVKEGNVEGVGSAAGVTEAAAGVKEGDVEVTEWVLFDLWRRDDDDVVEPLSLMVMVW